MEVVKPPVRTETDMRGDFLRENSNGNTGIHII